MSEALSVLQGDLPEPLLAPDDPDIREPLRDAPVSARRVRAFRPGLVIAAAFVILLAVAALVPSLIAHGDPLAADPRQAFLAPGAGHWLGTDENGRDELTRLVYGVRPSLLIGVSTTMLMAVLGSVLGLAAGFGPRLLDAVIGRFLDTMMAFPELLLPLVIITFWGESTLTGIIAIGLTGVPRAARLVRGQTLLVRGAGYVEAARTLELTRTQLVVRHVLPNALKPLLVLAPIWVGATIAMAATLSFLGFGAPPPTPEWGAMLAMGRNFLPVSWWLVAAPAGAIVVTVLTISALGRALMRNREGREL
jgi:peptide/nickel transport system permease protein